MAKTVLDDCGGKKCRIKAPAPHRIAAYPDFGYTTKTEPCKSKRTTCPVQLFFDRGQPKVRFCKRAGNQKPGYTIAVNSAAEAQRITAAACACWKKNRKSFAQCSTVATRALGGVSVRR